HLLFLLVPRSPPLSKQFPLASHGLPLVSGHCTLTLTKSRGVVPAGPEARQVSVLEPSGFEMEETSSVAGVQSVKVEENSGAEVRSSVSLRLGNWMVRYRPVCAPTLMSWRVPVTGGAVAGTPGF